MSYRPKLDLVKPSIARPVNTARGVPRKELQNVTEAGDLDGGVYNVKHTQVNSWQQHTHMTGQCKAEMPQLCISVYGFEPSCHDSVSLVTSLRRCGRVLPRFLHGPPPPTSRVCLTPHLTLIKAMRSTSTHSSQRGGGPRCMRTRQSSLLVWQSVSPYSCMQVFAQ